MAGAAYLILIVNSVTMRQPVAVLAGHQLAMLRMALGTGQGRMFCLFDCQLLIRIGMTTAADLFILVKRICNLQRGMDWMAGHTVSRGHLHSRAV